MTLTDTLKNLLAAPSLCHRYGISQRSRLRLLCAAFFVTTAAAIVPLASAYAADDEALLKEGKKLMAAKKYDEACPKLAESHKISSSPGTLLELALCHEKQGKLATAWGEMLDAETEARKAGNANVERRARANSKALEPKLPRLTVSVAANTPDLEITIDGKKLDLDVLGKSRPIDPGEHRIVASATGRKPWETTINLKKAERKSVAVPALEEDPNAAKEPDKPAKGPDKPNEGTQVTDPTKPKEGTDTQNPDKPKDPDEDKGPIHRAGRIVVDVGVISGVQLFLGGGSVGALSNLNYEYRVTDSFGLDAVELAACNNSVCRATVDPAFGVPIGGQAFVGYALSEKMHLGGRFFGSYLVTGGYSLFAGPSISVAAGERLWVGGSLLVGFGSQNARITGAMGEVPSEWVDLNGSDEVEVFLDRTVPEENHTNYGFSFGASAEVSFRLAEFGKGKSLMTGSLIASAWPTFLKTWDGFAIALPVGIGYRFH